MSHETAPNFLPHHLIYLQSTQRLYGSDREGVQGEMPREPLLLPGSANADYVSLTSYLTFSTSSSLF